MAAPDNAAELLPVSWQIAIAGFTLFTTLAGVGWRFLQSLKAPEAAHDQHVVLERAELADMNPLREFIRDFRPALERLAHIDQTATQMASQIEKLLEKLNKMEQDARVAKEVREELARRTGELERQGRWRNRNDD